MVVKQRTDDASFVDPSFIDRFASVFEHSPWIASKVLENGLPADLSADSLLAAFADVIRNATADQQLQLLRAHPQLGAAMVDAAALTTESRQEQHSAGLDQCTAEELGEFEALNRRYLERFGFPFIMAVKGRHRGEILQVFRQRLAGEPDAEFDTAIEEVIQIGGFRIAEVLAQA